MTGRADEALIIDHPPSPAGIAAFSERRIGRLANPLAGGLPAFLAPEGGVFPGCTIAQRTAAAPVAGNPRPSLPASLDGGIASAPQEDIPTHATPTAAKLLAILDNLRNILAIEPLAAAEACDLPPGVRPVASFHADDRPMHDDIERMRGLFSNPPSELTGA